MARNFVKCISCEDANGLDRNIPFARFLLEVVKKAKCYYHVFSFSRTSRVVGPPGQAQNYLSEYLLVSHRCVYMTGFCAARCSSACAESSHCVYIVRFEESIKKWHGGLNADVDSWLTFECSDKRAAIPIASCAG